MRESTPLGIWWWFWSPEPVWVMAQVMYQDTSRLPYRVGYLNSYSVRLSPSDIRHCLKFDNCTAYTSCKIHWAGAKWPNECAPPLNPNTQTVLSVKYWLWDSGVWKELPYRQGQEYRGPADPSIRDLLNPANYHGEVSSWSTQHGKIYRI